METAIIMLATGCLCIACFYMGAKVGQKINRGEEIEPPVFNPLKVYREKEAKKEAEMAQERIDAIMRNIENYDGTGYRQEDVPGR